MAKSWARVSGAFVAMLLLAACGGSTAAPSAGGGRAIDTEVQKAYDSFAKQYMPAVSLDLLQAAKAEGKLTYYHGQTGSDEAMLNEFKKNFPFISMEGVALSGGNMVERFQGEYRSGKYLADVVSITSLPAAAGWQKEGFVMNYTIGPANEIAPNHQVPGYIYSQYSSTLGIGWNPEKVKDEDAKTGLQKWEQLGDAKWQGKKFALNSDISGGTLQVLYTMEYKLFGTGLWEKMARNYSLFPGSVPIADAVVSGEADIAAGLSTESMEQKWVKGAPIHWSYAEPILAVPVVHFITAKPPHPNASKVFQEFVFSIPALSTWANQGALVDRKGVTDSRKVKNEAWYVPPDTAKLWQYTTEDISTTFPEAAKAWNGIFKK